MTLILERATQRAVMAANEYVEVGESEWKALPTSYSHAAHVMVYSTWPGRFMDKYDHKFAVAVVFSSTKVLS